MDEFEYDLALIDLNKVIELNPLDGLAYELRSQVYYYFGESDKAQADMMIANELGTEPYPYSQEIEPP